MGSLQYALQVVFSVVVCSVFIMFAKNYGVIPFTEEAKSWLPVVHEEHDGTFLRVEQDGRTVDIPLLNESMNEKLWQKHN